MASSAVTIPQGWQTGGGAASPDPFMQQVQSAYQGVKSATGQTPTSFQGSINRISPEDEASAYQTAFGGLVGPNFGMVDPSQVSAYYNLAQPYLFGTGMEGINRQLAAAGFAPSGTGGVGPQAELASRLQSQLGVQQANALLSNAQQGAQAQAQAGLGIGQTRYAALSRPNQLSFGFGGQGSGQGGGTQVKQQAPTFGGGGGPATSTAGNWWDTSYGQMNAGQGAAWNATQPGYYGDDAGAYGRYLKQNQGTPQTGDFWGASGYPSGPNE